MRVSRLLIAVAAIAGIMLWSKYAFDIQSNHNSNKLYTENQNLQGSLKDLSERMAELKKKNAEKDAKKKEILLAMFPNNKDQVEAVFAEEKPVEKIDEKTPAANK